MPRDLRAGQGKIQTAAQGLSSTINRALAVVGVGAGLGAMIAQAKQFISLAERQINAEVRVAAVVKATGMAAGFTADQLKKNASALQEVTTVGDEEILEMQGILLTFKTITGDTFKKATETILDMAAVMGTNARSGAMQLGRALEDPIRGVSALRRTGVSFSEAQKQQIKLLVESNQLHRAQALVLNVVRGQLGGVAREMAKTDVGRLQQAKNTLGDMREELGKKLIPSAIRFTEIQMKMANLYPPLIEGFLEMSNTIEKMFGDWSELVTSARQLTGIIKGEGESEQPKMGYIASGFAAMRAANLMVQEKTLRATMALLNKESTSYFYYNKKLKEVVEERDELDRRYWGLDIAEAKPWDKQAAIIEKKKRELQSRTFYGVTIKAEAMPALTAMSDWIKDRFAPAVQVARASMIEVMQRKGFFAEGIAELNEMAQESRWVPMLNVFRKMFQSSVGISDELKDAAKSLTEKYTSPLARIRREFETIEKTSSLLSPEIREQALKGVRDQLKELTAVSPLLSPGRLGFADFGRSLQDAILQREDPTRKVAFNTERANTLLERIDTALKSLPDKLNLGGLVP